MEDKLVLFNNGYIDFMYAKKDLLVRKCGFYSWDYIHKYGLSEIEKGYTNIYYF